MGPHVLTGFGNANCQVRNNRRHVEVCCKYPPSARKDRNLEIADDMEIPTVRWGRMEPYVVTGGGNTD
jgi:hypothetical protein